jgi:telomerase reverse transcriptase
MISPESRTMSVTIHTPANIIFVRNRMLYARAALNAQGGVRFGLRHIRMLQPVRVR